MRNPLSVLIIEDTEDDAILTARTLRRCGYDLNFERIDTEEAMKSALARQDWDIIIADYAMPHFSGLDALDLVRKSKLDVPFILVSGTIGEEIAVAAMKAGAHDYVMKDNLARLAPAVRRELHEAQVRQARRDAESTLRQRNRELALLNRVSQAFNSTLDLNKVLRMVLEQVRRLLNVAISSIWLIEPENGDLACREATGPSSKVVRGWRLTLGEGLAGWVAQQGQSAIVSDAWLDERHYKGVDQQTGLALRSFLGVPLRVREAVIGVLQMADTEINRFNQSDLILVESLAAVAAGAIENARMFAHEEQRAVALVRALQQRQELERLRSDLIQNLSHELRTPLAIARGYAELLESGDLGELRLEQKEPVSIIVRRVRLLSKMMDDLAAMLDAETHDLERELLDVAALVRATVTDFESAAEQSGLALTLKIAPDLPQVLGNSTHLHRILDKLMSNALKFTPSGGQIGVHLTREEDKLVLRVSDTGIGIPSDQLERVFERFYQVDGSMSRRYGGAGLGLALVKEIVEAHGGSVRAVSQGVPGEGSTFELTLPIM